MQQNCQRFRQSVAIQLESDSLVHASLLPVSSFHFQPGSPVIDSRQPPVIPRHVLSFKLSGRLLVVVQSEKRLRRSLRWPEILRLVPVNQGPQTIPSPDSLAGKGSGKHGVAPQPGRRKFTKSGCFQKKHRKQMLERQTLSLRVQ